MFAVILFFALSLSIFYVTRRFTLPFLPVLLVWSGAGWAQWMVWSATRKTWVRSLVWAFVVIGTLTQTAYFIGAFESSWRNHPSLVLGSSLKQSYGVGLTYTSAKGKVAWHAEGTHLPLPGASPLEDIHYYMGVRGSELLILDSTEHRPGRGGPTLLQKVRKSPLFVEVENCGDMIAFERRKAQGHEPR